MPSSFTSRLRATQEGNETGQPLVWTPHHLEWMARPPHERGYTPEAIEFARRSYLGLDVPKREGDQVHRFSASSVGGPHNTGFNCHRQMLFKYIGAPKKPTPIAAQDHMDQGSALHLHYQMEGLSAGYITTAENWEWHPQLRYGGKEDGLMTDNSLLELKFVKADKLETIVKGDRRYNKPPGPDHGHELQVTGLMMLKGLDEASLVYMSKDNGDFKEYRRSLNPNLVAELITLLGDLIDWVDIDELPMMIDSCLDQRGWMWKNCEFANFCPKVRTLSQVAAL